MQFKKVKNRIQVMAYRGYDKEKKRAHYPMVGSLDARSYEPSEELLKNLKGNEKQLLDDKIEELKLQDKKEHDSQVIDSIESQIDLVSSCLISKEYDISEQKAEQLFNSIDGLLSALKKIGYKKPKKSVRSKSSPSAVESDLFTQA